MLHFHQSQTIKLTNLADGHPDHGMPIDLDMPIDGAEATSPRDR